MDRSRPRPRPRFLSAALAVIWLAAGATGLFLGIVQGRWLLALAGVGALWYGVLWIHVARLGRWVTAREALAPWRFR